MTTQSTMTFARGPRAAVEATARRDCATTRTTIRVSQSTTSSQPPPELILTAQDLRDTALLEAAGL